MEKCYCRGLPGLEESALTLECVECEGRTVRCPRCGNECWWTDKERLQALNAAETHRWETGHTLVVVRNSAGVILREVLEDLAAA